MFYDYYYVLPTKKHFRIDPDETATFSESLKSFPGLLCKKEFVIFLAEFIGLEKEFS